MYKGIKKENRLLIIFLFSQIFYISSFLITQIYHPASGEGATDYYELICPIGSLIFIIAAYFVNKNNLKAFHNACKILIPLKIIFGQAGLLTVTYINSSIELIKSGQATFEELLANEDGFLFFNILPFIVTAFLESFILMKITEHKVNVDISGVDKALSVSTILYGLFGNTGVLYMNIVRFEALTNAKGIIHVLGYAFSGLILVIFSVSIIKNNNKIFIKLIKTAYIIILTVSSTAYMIQMLIHNYSYTGFSYLDVCNILSILISLTFALVITSTADLYLLDKMHKK